MALRLIEMACPEEMRHEVEDLLGSFQVMNLWHDQLMDEQTLLKILLPAEQSEAVLDMLENSYGRREDFRVIVTEVQAVVPRPPLEEEQEQKHPRQPRPGNGSPRISRHELEAEISGSARLTRIYLALILISTVVAAIGLWRNNVAVIIGAMVIAPLLGPSMATAFAATLGDGALGRRAVVTTLAGVLLGFTAAVALGTMLPLKWQMSPTAGGGFYVPELMARTQVGLADIVLALAAGTAGALAFTTGIHTPLVGVMVAVALLPPLVASGLAAGSARWVYATRAFLLFCTNLICINLAGVVTFLASGIRPRTWWEVDRARRASRIAIVSWLLILLALAVAIVLAGRLAG